MQESAVRTQRVRTQRVFCCVFVKLQNLFESMLPNTHLLMPRVAHAVTAACAGLCARVLARLASVARRCAYVGLVVTVHARSARSADLHVPGLARQAREAFGTQALVEAGKRHVLCSVHRKERLHASPAARERGARCAGVGKDRGVPEAVVAGRLSAGSLVEAGSQKPNLFSS